MHPLTEKMYRELKKEHTREEVDAIVTEWLEGRVQEMCTYVFEPKKDLRQVLGLTPKESTMPYIGGMKVNVSDVSDHLSGRPVGPQEWCEHMEIKASGLGAKFHSESHPWLMPQDTKFCPICAAPRPAPKETLEAKLRNFWRLKMVTWICDQDYKEMTELIAQHYEESKGLGR